MAEGVKDTGVLLKIGFVNDKIEQRIDAYKQLYDVLILHDGTMDYVVRLLKEIFGEGEETAAPNT